MSKKGIQGHVHPRIVDNVQVGEFIGKAPEPLLNVPVVTQCQGIFQTIRTGMTCCSKAAASPSLVLFFSPAVLEWGLYHINLITQ